jgi:predicted nucleic acid-binding protein
MKDHELVLDNVERALAADDEILIAPVAYYEVRRGLLVLGSAKKMQKFERLCESFSVGRFDNSILDTATEIYAELRKIGRIIDDADIFIAAFCRHHGFYLVTNNTKHFENIPGLELFDWTLV